MSLLAQELLFHITSVIPRSAVMSIRSSLVRWEKLYEALLSYELRQIRRSPAPSTVIEMLEISKCTHQRERIPQIVQEWRRGEGSWVSHLFANRTVCLLSTVRSFSAMPHVNQKKETLPSGSCMKSAFYCWRLTLSWSSCFNAPLCSADVTREIQLNHHDASVKTGQ